MPFSSEICEIVHSYICTILKGLNGNSSIIYSLLSPICIKFGTGDVHKNLIAECDFCQNRHTESIAIFLFK